MHATLKEKVAMFNEAHVEWLNSEPGASRPTLEVYTVLMVVSAREADSVTATRVSAYDSLEKTRLRFSFLFFSYDEKFLCVFASCMNRILLSFFFFVSEKRGKK